MPDLCIDIHYIGDGKDSKWACIAFEADTGKTVFEYNGESYNEVIINLTGYLHEGIGK